jgi:hypothetical protein
VIPPRQAGDRHDCGFNVLPVGFFADLPDDRFEPYIDAAG